MRQLTTLLTGEISQVVNRVKHSLVVLSNGHHGYGAGIIWRSDGLILTNYHVAANDQLSAALINGSHHATRVVASDPEIDLALLQIDENNLQGASIADSLNLQVGQYVMAFGHPWGNINSTTAGLISGFPTVKTTKSGKIMQVIRTDAQLAPGFSGGPLVDASGNVIGINTMIIGGDQGIAIPIHLAAGFIQHVLESTSATVNYA